MTEAKPTDSSSPPHDGRSVLVLEPDEAVAEAITRAIREASPGIRVQTARSLQAAQELVADQHPELFVLDIDPAYEAGQEFLYDLRTSHPEAKAIILTEFHLPKHREQAAGLGAIHFLEKPFPHGDFVDLAQALLSAPGKADERFQGKLSDLHIADIIQLKCMSGATSALEFTGPKGEKAQVYFEHGQVRHATAPGCEGVTAFNQIVGWKGGMISELSPQGTVPRTIDVDWQVLLMEAVRKLDEHQSESPAGIHQGEAVGGKPAALNVLVIDDSLMLLSFVKEILAEAEYNVRAAATAHEALDGIAEDKPDLILLDHVLPDMNGDEVCRHLTENPATAKTPIVYMSGFGADLSAETAKNPNVIGTLHKPFTSELLLQTVGKYLPRPEKPAHVVAPTEPPPSAAVEPVIFAEEPATTPPTVSEVPPPETVPMEERKPAEPVVTDHLPTAAASASGEVQERPVKASEVHATSPLPTMIAADGVAYFSGHTGILSLACALKAIAAEKLTGTFRAFWDRAPVELLAHNGQIVLVTTRDPELYCPEAPITLLNVDAEKNAAARQRQAATGCPLFLTLANEGLILKEPALDLVQHYGQKLFALLWTAGKVRFTFTVQSALEDWAAEHSAFEEDVDHLMLNTLRFTQYLELGDGGGDGFDPLAVPAYTRSGYERIQRLRLTVAEAQFASQFNGSRSTQQIAKNLRLDLKFARLTLFRFLALEIVECWPPASLPARETGGAFRRFLGMGD